MSSINFPIEGDLLQHDFVSSEIMSFLTPEQQLVNSKISRLWPEIPLGRLCMFNLMKSISNLSMGEINILLKNHPEVVPQLVNMKFHEVLNPSQYKGEFLSKIIEVKFKKNPSEAIEYLQGFPLEQRKMIEALKFMTRCADLRDDQITEIIALCPDLKSLALSGSNFITGEFLTRIPEGIHLERLMLENCENLNEDFLADFFSGATQIKEINLSDSLITGGCLTHISEKNHLENLFLEGCKNLNEDFLVAFSSKTAYLKKVYLSVTEITGKVLLSISDQCQLEELFLGHCKNLNEELLAEFFQLNASHLNVVELEFTEITGECLAYLPKENQIKKIGLFDCKNLDQVYLQNLSKEILEI
ncbi:MAG: hypothetical protein PVI40_03775 [Chlamydiota bacterium]|jgi:hypothetical protein